MNETIRVIYSDNEKQRVIIFRRQDNSLGFVEEYFSEHEFEMCWVPCSSRNASFFDTLQTALREVYSRVDWLIGKEPPLEAN